MFSELMASSLYGVAKVRSTRKCMVPTVKHGVLLWGCMSAAGVGEMHFIDGIMNSQMYCSILKEKFSNMTIIQNTHLRPLLCF
ncbi:unnamed protein product [Staurois parvus]|uniref:Uncharacterized protein n=1 Tax=Staurois parvus TaxID=386267 RepID=A0ABN9FZV7_9NEOB|nr:unnamed protein product [Staurois parvus]